MDHRYNPKLFLVGFLMNLLRKFPLLLAVVILAIIGVHNPPCRHAALGILILAIVWSLVQQFQIKYTVEHSSNPNFEPFAKAMMSDDWKEEIKNIVQGDSRKSEENDAQE